MKKILFFLFYFNLFFFLTKTSCQENAMNSYDVGTISLSLVMPDEVDELTTSHLSKLENKILKILTSNGLSGNGLDANFVIFPKIEILNIDEMSGMETMVAVELEVSLFVKQIDNNILFASFEKTVKGIAKKESQAIKNAIKKIPIRGKQVDAFLSKAKGRIVAYYKNKCQDIILEADTYCKTQEYEKAISMLMAIPAEVGDCFVAAQHKALECYKAYSNQKCAEYIQKAKAEIAKQHYNKAMNYIGYIDPSSDCKNESLQIIQETTPKIDAKEKKHWDFILQRYKDHVALKKSRIEAMAKVAQAYYQRSQPTIIYKSLY